MIILTEKIHHFFCFFSFFFLVLNALNDHFSKSDLQVRVLMPVSVCMFLFVVLDKTIACSELDN